MLDKTISNEEGLQNNKDASKPRNRDRDPIYTDSSLKEICKNYSSSLNTLIDNYGMSFLTYSNNPLSIVMAYETYPVIFDLLIEQKGAKKFLQNPEITSTNKKIEPFDIVAGLHNILRGYSFNNNKKDPIPRGMEFLLKQPNLFEAIYFYGFYYINAFAEIMQINGAPDLMMQAKNPKEIVLSNDLNAYALITQTELGKEFLIDSENSYEIMHAAKLCKGFEKIMSRKQDGINLMKEVHNLYLMVEEVEKNPDEFDILMNMDGGLEYLQAVKQIEYSIHNGITELKNAPKGLIPTIRQTLSKIWGQ